MAALSNNDRIAAWEQWMRENKATITGAMTRGELRAAIDAADNWADSNAASYNSALPLPARTVLSASQKAALLNIIIAKRFAAGS